MEIFHTGLWILVYNLFMRRLLHQEVKENQKKIHSDDEKVGDEDPHVKRENRRGVTLKEILTRSSHRKTKPQPCSKC